MKKKSIIIKKHIKKGIKITKNSILIFKKLTGININSEIKKITAKKIVNVKLINFNKQKSMNQTNKDVVFIRKLRGFQSNKHSKRNNT